MSGTQGAVPADRSASPRWGFAVVTGHSMRPRLRPGDRLLIDHRRRPVAGDVVVARVPGRPPVLKRAVERRPTELGEPGWWLLSDAPEHGTDSRTFGAVAEADVVAVVVVRIWPPRRRAPVRKSPGG